MKIPLSKPDIGEREIELVTEVLRSGRLSMGPRLEEFEEKFAAYTGRRFAIAASSGTAALHMCAMSIGLSAHDEVLTTPFTFVATVNSFLYESAQPAFVDVNPATLNMDPEALAEAVQHAYAYDEVRKHVINRLSGRVLKAIMPVDVFGMPCNMPAIQRLAREWNLYVIEDACEALGAQVGGHHVGAFSHAAAFAFYPNKQMTTGEGGMVVTDDPQIAKSCRALRNQGRDDSAGWLRHEYFGYNYRLSELHCALGIAQLERLDERLAARARVARLYSNLLASLPQIILPWDPPDCVRSWFAYVIRTQGAGAPVLRNRLMAGLRARGIECQVYFPAVHRQPYISDMKLLPTRPLPIAESASERCLALPFYASMTEAEVKAVCDAIREIVREIPAVRAHMPALPQGRRARGAA